MDTGKWLRQEDLRLIARHWKQGDTWSRRSLLTALAGSAALLLLPRPVLYAAERTCAVTPSQTEGPFYPVHTQKEKDNDLTVIAEAAAHASGQVIYVTGQVRDAKCRPIPGAVVEIWQANGNGRYKHPEDQNTDAAFDPYFQYWGIHTTDQDGRYRFKTVKPAPYPAGFFWTRPSHIHFKVHRRAAPTLTTQMYFAGDPYLSRDRIYQAIPPAARSRVVVALEPPTEGLEPDSRLCRFDLVV